MPYYPAHWLNSTATVYTRDPAGGGYTLVANAALTCRLQEIDLRGAPPQAPEREAAGTLRKLFWPADYELPHSCQLLIDGERWNPLQATVAAPKAPNGSILFRRCDVVRADNG